MSPLQHQQMLQLDADLSPRRRQLVQLVAEFRLVSGEQLRRLSAPLLPGTSLESDRRLLRRDLDRLTEIGCLFRLERQIGGVRGGSAGYIYALGAVGLRLVDRWHGRGVPSPRSRYEPTVGFQDHALAVSEIVVQTVEAARAAGVEIDYDIERHSWRSWLGPHGEQLRLKPDAELLLRAKDYEDHWWLEVDRGTERATTLRRKLQALVDYFEAGREQADRDVFPRTLWVVLDQARAEVLRELAATLGPEHTGLITVTLADRAVPLLLPETQP